MVARWSLGYVPRVLLHAANLRHWTDNFTSLPKEDVLRIFIALKNPTSSAGFEPANLGIRGQHATSAPPKLEGTHTEPGGREVPGVKLKPFDCWDRAFESRGGHGCSSVVSVTFFKSDGFCYELITLFRGVLHGVRVCASMPSSKSSRNLKNQAAWTRFGL
jgi:hypothetical protein